VLVDGRKSSLASPSKVANWSEPLSRLEPTLIGTSGNPAEFLEGHVRSDVATVKVTFANGGTMTVKPIRGFVLAVIPREHLAKDAQVSGAVAYDTAGRKLGSESLLPPKPARIR
jgi:hypothetical protein